MRPAARERFKQVWRLSASREKGRPKAACKGNDRSGHP
ncbi:hypothetical protein SJ05684_c31670 [Sinorhizobium sojae CCBAU 05684]|uniref:Uncharacterized protein n=1 Tax=Sinorhizobium sojae CCBAU 05684 TaxID=716928 RepID=A0A249PF81_9HYPH|nr:hypothetical protein SJ05684_c31670 [Sinorhizobium sojae CCBAU 05684]